MDWTRKLSEPVDLGGPEPVRTLADVRAHLLSLPEEQQEWRPVQYVAKLIMDAAEGEYTGDVSVALRMFRNALRMPD
jgi:hypothetical protein